MVQKIRKDRRDFLAGLAVSAGTGSMLAGLATGDAAAPRKKVTAQDVIDLIVENTTGSPLPPEKTVDTFKAGDPAQEVTGIVTTFLATLEVLKKAKDIGANLVITHEPTYYNHLDKVDALVADPVFEAKHRFIQESGVVIRRLHDYWHLRKPDGILSGLVQRLELRQIHPDNNRIYDIAKITFQDLCNKCKQALCVGNLRVVGNPSMVCRRIGLFAGWGGATGGPQIELLSKEDADVVICGETAEWTTCE